MSVSDQLALTGVTVRWRPWRDHNAFALLFLFGELPRLFFPLLSAVISMYALLDRLLLSMIMQYLSAARESLR